ncbi:MAG: TolC family protein [Acidobacteriota bacterium]
MLRRALTMVPVLAVVCAGGAAAQERLPLSEAVSRALAANPDLRAVSAEVDAAAAEADRARAGYLPRVDLVEAWQRGDAPLFAFSALLGARSVTAGDFAPSVLNDPDPVSLFRTGLVVQQTVFDGFQTASRVEAARLGREAAAATLEHRRHAVALHVVEAYARGLVAAAHARAAASALAAAEADEARTRDRRDAGLATDADLLALAVHVADVRARVIQAEADVDLAQARLNRLMGAPLDAAYVLEEPGVPAMPAPEGSEAQAVAARPDLRAATLGRSIAEAGRRAARGAWLPTVGVQASYDWTGRDFADRPGAWVAGAEIRWNLFAGGADRARVAAAEASVRAADARRASAEAEVRESARAARRQLDAARAREAVGRAAAAEAREAERVTRERFEAGLATVTDLLRASTATLDAELRATTARLDVVVTAALLQQSVGQLPGLP